MKAFFGAIFKTIGSLFMVASVLWGLFIGIALADAASQGRAHSGEFYWAAFLLLVGTPFLAALLLYRLGSRMVETASEGELPRPAQALAPKPSRFISPRQIEEVDLDVAPETGPTPEPAKSAQPFNKPDPTAMGVDTFQDPEKKQEAK